MLGLRVFIVGGEVDESPSDFDWREFGRRIGLLIGKSEHKAVLCSYHDSSLDYHVLTGISESNSLTKKQKVIVHHPESPFISDSWHKLVSKLNILEPEYNSYESIKFIDEVAGKILDRDLMQRAYLLSQLQALNESDAMVVVGGKIDGSAIMTISLAIKKDMPILPLPFFGGAARYAFDRQSRKLIEVFGRQVIEKFKNPSQLEAVFLPMIDKIYDLGKKKKRLKVFISYAWSRAELADFIEALLRRRNDVEIFRDEMDIRVGKNISRTIDYEIINGCDIFIALWCSDYVQSPYCYDEVDLWVKNRHDENLYILLLDNTRPVWPSLRDSKDSQKFSSRTLEGYDQKTEKISREKVNLALFSILKEHINL